MKMGKTVRGVLLSQMECPPSLEGEFHDWYDREHIPERLRVPGFLSAARYEAVGDGPRYLARYNLEDLSVLAHPDYVRLKQRPTDRTSRLLSAVTLFTRYTGRVFSARQREDAPARPEDAPYILLAGFTVPREAEKDFDAWYEEEHTDRLLQAEGWWRCVRLKVVSGEPEPWTDIAIHEVADLETLDSPERIESRKTPWSQRIRSQPWFQGGRLIVYRKFAGF
ncbi:MAG: hypothetical protein HYY21_07895 [Candidatus Tectomicrobia bacterium]|nr:hypothetical protein [Candidatus Tectomicrobia bacterium]